MFVLPTIAGICPEDALRESTLFPVRTGIDHDSIPMRVGIILTFEAERSRWYPYADGDTPAGVRSSPVHATFCFCPLFPSALGDAPGDVLIRDAPKFPVYAGMNLCGDELLTTAGQLSTKALSTCKQVIMSFHSLLDSMQSHIHRMHFFRQALVMPRIGPCLELM